MRWPARRGGVEGQAILPVQGLAGTNRDDQDRQGCLSSTEVSVASGTLGGGHALHDRHALRHAVALGRAFLRFCSLREVLDSATAGSPAAGVVRGVATAPRTQSTMPVTMVRRRFSSRPGA